MFTPDQNEFTEDTFNTIKRYDIMCQEYHKGARENEDLLPPEN